jgi:hypothetical protein
MYSEWNRTSETETVTVDDSAGKSSRKTDVGVKVKGDSRANSI